MEDPEADVLGWRTWQIHNSECPSRHCRDHPTSIKRRFAGIGAFSLLAPIILLRRAVPDVRTRFCAPVLGDSLFAPTILRLTSLISGPTLWLIARSTQYLFRTLAHMLQARGADLFAWLGLRRESFLAAATLPLLLTVSLFTGPIATLYYYGKDLPHAVNYQGLPWPASWVLFAHIFCKCRIALRCMLSFVCRSIWLLPSSSML